VGSGNPEEGELRPQLLDRFGLSVEVGSPKEIKDRVEVIKRRDAYDRDPDTFHEQWKKKEATERRKITKARGLLPEVTTPDATLEVAAELCTELGADGLRGELTLIRAGRALAALTGKTEVTAKHIKSISASALRHRLRRDPLDEAGSTARVMRVVDAVIPS
jgi:magnesium chelatase subunit I